jgi:amino acid transporter
MYRDKNHVHSLGTAVLVLAAISMAFGTISSFSTYGGRYGVGRMTGAGVFGGLSAIVVIVYVVFFMIWHYNNWELVDPEFRKTTPGRAVGFLFIPFYNFYWIFVSFIWLWQGLNETGKRYMGNSWIELQQGIPIAFAILILLSAIPFVSIGAGVLTILLIIQSNSSIRELWDAKPQASGGQGSAAG